MPATGVVLITLPSGTTGSNASVFVPIRRRDPAIVLIASFSGRFRTSGTATVLAPAATTSLTVPPRSTFAPGSGSWLTTVFGSTPVTWLAVGLTVTPDWAARAWASVRV